MKSDQGKPRRNWAKSSTSTLLGSISEHLQKTRLIIVPDGKLHLIPFDSLVNKAAEHAGISRAQVNHWCIHPGGRKILEAVHNCLGFTNGQLSNSYDVLRKFGNMSSPTVLFVLEKIMHSLKANEPAKIFGAAFGPGISMETFILSS